jgi:uncharacterized protein YjdB
MAGAVTALGELRRALRMFLDAAGEDPQLKAAVGEVRALDARLGEASRNGQQDGPSPGQRAAGQDVRGPGDNQDAGSPGGRAAAASTPSQADRGSAKTQARAQMGASPSSAKGSGSNLPPFMQRQRMKGRATARGGP